MKPIVDQQRDRAALGEAEPVPERVGDPARQAIDLAKAERRIAEPDRDAIADDKARRGG